MKPQVLRWTGARPIPARQAHTQTGHQAIFSDRFTPHPP